MPSSSIRQAYQILQSVIDGDKKSLARAKVVKHLEQVSPLLKTHISRLQREVENLHRRGEKFNVDNASQELHDDMQEFRNFLLIAEQQLNDKKFTKINDSDSFGNKIKQKWMSEVFKNDLFDIRTICDITDLSAAHEESGQILYTVNTASKEDGARQLLAEARVRLASPSKGAQSALLQVMEELSNAQRYEILAKVDLYIRSGRADLDLDPSAKNTQALRASLQSFMSKKKSDAKYAASLDKAQAALFARFDEVFVDFHIRAKQDGSLEVTHKKTISANNRSSLQTAPSGYVDAAIWDIDGKTLHAAIVSSNETARNMTTQGQQLARYKRALEQYLQKSKTGQLSLSMTAILRAQYPEENDKPGGKLPTSRKQFLLQLGADLSDKTFISHLDKLQILTALTAYHHVHHRENTRFLLVGKDVNWDPQDYKSEHFSAKALETVLAILEKVAHPDTYLSPNSTKDSVFNQTLDSLNQVLSVIEDSPQVQQSHKQLHLIGEQLKNKIKIALDSGGDVHVLSMKALANTLSSVSHPAPKMPEETISPGV